MLTDKKSFLQSYQKIIDNITIMWYNCDIILLILKNVSSERKQITMKNNNLKYHITYGIFLFAFFAMIVWLVFRCNQPSLSEQLFADAVGFESGWRTEDGDEVNLSKLQKLEEAEPFEAFSIYHTLPETLEEGNSLYFRSKNIFFSVFVDGELVYEPYVPQSVLYTKSSGTRWNCIPILQEYEGKQIEVQIITAYANAKASVDNIYLGNAAGMIMHTISDRIVAFITCILMLFVGLLLVVVDIPVNTQAQKNHELLYLGMFAVSISIWCLSETNLIQLYFDDSRMMQVVSCFSLMLIPIPLILYLNVCFGFKVRWFVPAFCTLSVLNIVICWGLHFLKIRDVRETLILTHVMLVFSAATMFYSILRESIMKRKKQSKKVYWILRTIGLSSLSVATIIDIIRFYCGSGSDNAMFVRMGLLIFIVCYGSSSLENTINAVKRSAQAEFVRRLAYHDGLTGIGNRTAFQERLADLEEKKGEFPEIGIIMFDVNDLKLVNDTLGHHCGDNMLTESAKIILNAFEPMQGECFRIGGDEFAVFLSGDHVEERYQFGVDQFRMEIRQHNEKPDKAFQLSIAHGFAVYERASADQKLMDVYQDADQRMYENKKAIKASRNSSKENWNLNKVRA